MDKFRTVVETCNPDVYIVVETWLCEEILDSEVSVPTFSLHRRDRNRKGGGILIGTKIELNGKVLWSLACSEILCVRITPLKGKSIDIIGAYHSGKGAREFLQKLDDKLDSYGEHINVIIAGDLNLPEVKWSPGDDGDGLSSQDMVRRIMNRGYEQAVTEGTRDIDSYRSNLLDVVLVKPEQKINRSDVFDIDLSDHKAVVVDVLTGESCRSSQPPGRPVWCYKKANKNALKDELWTQFEPWVQSNHLNVDSMWQSLVSIISNAMNNHIPRVEVKHNQDPPYYNGRIRKLKRKARVLYNLSKGIRGQHGDRSKLRETTALLNEAKKLENDKFMKRMFKEGDEGGGWTNLYRHIRRQKGGERDIPTLIDDEGKEFTNDRDKANALNSFYTKVFNSKSANPITNPSADRRGPQPITIGAAWILRILKKLKNGKAPGMDGLTTNLLKLCGLELAIYLEWLFKRILKDGQIPQEWKEARIIPVYKGGERWRLTNYRPISLTSAICKVFETLLNQYIWYILTQKGVVVESQHGFRAGYSCETQLTGLVQDISDALDAGDEVDAIFLDMRKAFDTVDHEILIQKLASVIDDEAVTKTIQNFLSGRTQRVQIGAVTSEESYVTSGVPQGSVLGPLLFTIYVNDLAHNLNCRVRLFADDCVVYAKLTGEDEHAPLQQDIESIQCWMSNNRMSLNLDKCEVVTFSTKHHSNEKNYHIDGRILPFKTGYKYLGVWLDKKLDWGEHINRITSKCIRNINFVMRNLKGSTVDTKNHAYKTLLRPLLEYGCAVWDPHKAKDVTALEKVQGMVARRVTGRTRKWVTGRNANGKIQKTWENPREMVSELGWDSLESRRKVSRLCNMFRARAGAPGWSELNSRLKLREYHGRTGSGGLLHEPYANKNCGKFSFVSRTTRDWNQLGCGLLSPDLSIHAFRQLVTEKNHSRGLSTSNMD